MIYIHSLYHPHEWMVLDGAHIRHQTRTNIRMKMCFVVFCVIHTIIMIMCPLIWYNAVVICHSYSFDLLTWPEMSRHSRIHETAHELDTIRLPVAATHSHETLT